MRDDTIGYAYAAAVTVGGAVQAFARKKPSLLLLGGTYGAFAALGSNNMTVQADDVAMLKMTSVGHAATMFLMISDKRALLPFAPFGLLSVCMCARTLMIKPFTLRGAHH